MVAAQVGERIPGVSVFDAFGDDAEVEAVGELDGGAHDGGVVGISAAVASS